VEAVPDDDGVRAGVQNLRSLVAGGDAAAVEERRLARYCAAASTSSGPPYVPEYST
jgi:hypothetical protein